MSFSEREYLRLQKEQKKKKNRTTAFIILAVVLVIAAGITIWQLAKNGVFRKATESSTSTEHNVYTNERGMSVGDPDAPVTVIEFSNFTCSHCKNFALQEEEEFIKTYVDTGKVYYTSYPHPWNDENPTYNASLAAYCAADQNAFYAYKYLVFRSVTSYNDLSDASISKYAKNLGLDMDAFESCLKSPDLAARNAQSNTLAKGFNVTGTPSFIVNGRLFYMNQLNSAVDAALAESGN